MAFKFLESFSTWFETQCLHLILSVFHLPQIFKDVQDLCCNNTVLQGFLCGLCLWIHCTRYFSNSSNMLFCAGESWWIFDKETVTVFSFLLFTHSKITWTADVHGQTDNFCYLLFASFLHLFLSVSFSLPNFLLSLTFF